MPGKRAKQKPEGRQETLRRPQYGLILRLSADGGDNRKK